jgi:IS30 family transposase
MHHLRDTFNSLEVQMERLTSVEREQIASWKRRGFGVRDIARRLGRDHSVVSREVRRNAGQVLPYEAAKAQHFAERRSHRTNRAILEKDPELLKWVTARLWDDWSPEQIAGRLKKDPPPEVTGNYVCHESIYAYIYSAAPHLYHRLRKAHPRRYPKHGRTPRTGPILGKTSIWDRPQLVNDRTEVGHWEADTVEGRRTTSDHLSVHEERQTRFTRIHRIHGKAGPATLAALRATMRSVPAAFAKSFTFDNGFENTQHRKLHLPTYFCDPYSSWQKGSVENTNGLIRQYFPKRTDFTKITDKQIQFVEDRLNNRPRKILNYQTPTEAVTSLSGALNP